MSKDLQGKKVWITGASSGIGAALAKKCSALGAEVILSARSVDKLNAVAENCIGKTHIYTLDLAHSESLKSLVAKVISEVGFIDLLVNNGGISQRSTVLETSEEVDRKLMEVNYFGNIALTKLLLPYWNEEKKGGVIVISSLSGKFGFYLRSAYAASKFALVGFYESLRLEEENNNLKVLIAFPGFINTDISKHALDANGKPSGNMDNNQNQGISAEKCADIIVSDFLKGKRDSYPGGKEMLSLKIKRFFPGLFHKVIKKQNPQ